MIRAEYQRARARNPHHNGITQAIRDLITARGPLTIKEMAEALSQPENRVRSLVIQMLSQRGGFVCIKGWPHRYAPYLQPAETTRYAPEFRELKRDLMAHMKLAMLTRRR